MSQRPITVDSKECSRCHEVKPAEGFYRDARMASGLTSTCRACRAEAHARYEVEHREERTRYAAEYREANAERVRARDRARYAAVAEQQNAAAAERRRLNRLRAIEIHGGACVQCGSTEDLILDHIEGGGSAHRRSEHDSTYCLRIVKAGVPDPRLQVLCEPCHKPKTAREVTAYWQRRMAERSAAS
jgi:5-methylcytosine-specific restriction endonuclease McrA